MMTKMSAMMLQKGFFLNFIFHIDFNNDDMAEDMKQRNVTDML